MGLILIATYGFLFAGFLLFLAFMLTFYHWRSLSHRRTCRMLPRPQQIPIFGIGLEVAAVKHEDLFDWFTKKWRELGDVIHFQLLGLPIVVLLDPEDIEAVFNNSQHITKGAEYDFMMPWLCEGLLTSTGKKWHTRRKMLTPTFHFRILENYLPIFNKNAQLLTKKLIKSAINTELVDIDSYVSLCTLDIICETAMGTSLDCQQGQAAEYVAQIRRAGEIIVLRNLTFWMANEYLFRHSSVGREFYKTIGQLHEFTEKVIRERKESYTSSYIQQKLLTDYDVGACKRRTSFLDCLLEMQREDPTVMTDADVREEVDTFMFEGHDTTSAALTWALFMIAAHSEVQDRVQEEINQIFGDEDREVTAYDLHQMQYLEMVIKETLRLYPSVPYISRRLTTDLQLKKYTIPAETNVSIAPYLIHRNPKIYREPEKFDPDRFLPDVSKERHPYAYIPFSAGSRNCIGQKFAMMESKIILSTILRKLRLHTTLKNEDVKVVPHLILRPIPNIYLTFSQLKTQ